MTGIKWRLAGSKYQNCGFKTWPSKLSNQGSLGMMQLIHLHCPSVSCVPTYCEVPCQHPRSQLDRDCPALALHEYIRLSPRWCVSSPHDPEFNSPTSTPILLYISRRLQVLYQQHHHRNLQTTPLPKWQPLRQSRWDFPTHQSTFVYIISPANNLLTTA